MDFFVEAAVVVSPFVLTLEGDLTGVPATLASRTAAAIVLAETGVVGCEVVVESLRWKNDPEEILASSSSSELLFSLNLPSFTVYR